MAPLRLFVTALCVGAALAGRCGDLEPKSNPQAAPGVRYKVLANDLNYPRGIVTDTKGNLLVIEGFSNGIRRIVLDEGEGLDTCVKSSTQLVADNTLNHGIEVSADGKTIFASSNNDVYAYEYNAEKGTVGQAKNIITGMLQNGHPTRTLLVPRHNPNLLLVSRGSNDNLDKNTINIESARSQIRIFKIDELLAGTSAVQYSDGQVLGWGLRNSVGVAEHPTTGNIWSVENSLDDMHRKGVDIHNTNPGEELNFHGLPNDTHSKVFGQNYGYPACVAIFDASNVEGYPGGAKTGFQMVGDQAPSNYTDEWCRDETIAPRLTFAAHLAPLDIEFSLSGRHAFVAFHGSWNRQPPNGYRLSRVAFSRESPEADWHSDDAEQQLLWNADNSVCPDKCFRPAGLAFDRAGKRLFMTSDHTNELFIVTGCSL